MTLAVRSNYDFQHNGMRFQIFSLFVFHFTIIIFSLYILYTIVRGFLPLLFHDYSYRGHFSMFKIPAQSLYRMDRILIGNFKPTGKGQFYNDHAKKPGL